MLQPQSLYLYKNSKPSCQVTGGLACIISLAVVLQLSVLRLFCNNSSCVCSFSILELSQFHNLVYGSAEAVGVLASCSGIVWLAATTTLN